MPKILLFLRGYDPYDYSVVDVSTRSMSLDMVEQFLREVLTSIIKNKKTPDYWTYKVLMIDQETNNATVMYEHSNPLKERIEVNLEAKRKKVILVRRFPTASQMMFDAPPSCSIEDEEFDEENDSEH